jgi:hypothetical protein
LTNSNSENSNTGTLDELAFAFSLFDMLSRARTGRASPPLSKDGEAYDVESGGVRGNALTLRRLLTRRSRVVLGVFACVLVVYYYGFVESSGAGRYAQERPPVVPIRTDLDELLPVDNIWDEMPPPIDDSPLGNAAAPPKRPPRPDDRRYYVIDKHGDHYLTNIGRKIAPLHPGPKDMHEPEDLFPDVEILEFLKAPVENVFPAERIREIVSPPLDSDNEWRKAALPSDSWNAMWQPPKKWDSPTPGVKTVQWQSFTTKDRDWESKEQEELRIRRREAVRRGFVYAWQKYKDAAWGE